VSFLGDRLYFLTLLVALQYWQSATAPKRKSGLPGRGSAAKEGCERTRNSKIEKIAFMVAYGFLAGSLVKTTDGKIAILDINASSTFL
jgi:hypothetical protein